MQCPRGRKVKGQGHTVHGYENRHCRMVASDHDWLVASNQRLRLGHA